MSDTTDIVARLRGLSADHSPDGWPAVQMRDITALCEEVTRLRAALAQAGVPKPIGYMNEGHLHELQMGRLPYGYVYPSAGVGAETPIYTAHASPAQREPLTDAQLAQGLRAAIDIPTAHEVAAFRKGARWAWGVKLADSGATGGTKGAA